MTALLPNSSFSTKSPWLQLALDSTSLGAFKTCPRYYYYTTILGYQPKAESVHLTFGLLMHGSVERYHHAKAEGLGHEEALQRTVAWLLRETWDKALGRPWFSGDSYKNRGTILRTVIWYLDKYGDNDTLETVILSSGKPAVELSFSFDSGFVSRLTGEPFLLCGHLDRLALLNGAAYIPDVKTTKSELSPRYWASHDPSNQFSIYLLAGEIVYNLPVKGLIVDGVQVLVGSSRFDRKLITKDAAQMEEFYSSLRKWIMVLEDCAGEAASGGEPSLAYPMNETSCGKYGGCEFQGICSRSPVARQQWLDTGFRRRVWDPLQRRGDI
jgi:hypothetical protein